METGHNNEQKDEENGSSHRWHIVPKVVTIMRFELGHTAECLRKMDRGSLVFGRGRLRVENDQQEISEKLHPRSFVDYGPSFQGQQRRRVLIEICVRASELRGRFDVYKNDRKFGLGL
jgi:hypothetical protein